MSIQVHTHTAGTEYQGTLLHSLKQPAALPWAYREQCRCPHASPAAQPLQLGTHAPLVLTLPSSHAFLCLAMQCQPQQPGLQQLRGSILRSGPCRAPSVGSHMTSTDTIKTDLHDCQHEHKIYERPMRPPCQGNSGHRPCRAQTVSQADTVRVQLDSTSPAQQQQSVEHAHMHAPKHTKTLFRISPTVPLNARNSPNFSVLHRPTPLSTLRCQCAECCSRRLKMAGMHANTQKPRRSGQL
jgi:hypothetical protein